MEKERDPALRCKARWAGHRCHLRSGHSGAHRHDMGDHVLAWGRVVRKR